MLSKRRASVLDPEVALHRAFLEIACDASNRDEDARKQLSAAEADKAAEGEGTGCDTGYCPFPGLVR